MVQPIFFVVMQVMWLATWIFAVVMLYTLHPESHCSADSSDSVLCSIWNTIGFYGVWSFVVITILTIHEMISALACFTTSYVAGVWYYAGDDSEGVRALPGGNTCCDCKLTFRAIGTGVWYHTGTFAFGGILSALTGMLVALCWVMLQAEHALGNKVGEVMMKCITCCTACLDRIVSWVNWHAYIHCALLGTNFCRSAASAFSVTVRYPVRMAVAGNVAFVATTSCQLLVCALTSTVAYFLMEVEDELKVDAKHAPLLIIAIISYLLAGTVLQSLSAATATMMHCLAADEDTKNEANRAYVPDKLQEFLRLSDETQQTDSSH